MLELPEQVVQGEKLQAAAFSKDTETWKVSAATTLSRSLADSKLPQARVDSVLPSDVLSPSPPSTNGQPQALGSGRSSPLRTSPSPSPSRLVRAATVQDNDEDDDDDDNWQPLPQGRDEPPRPAKRKYRATRPGDNAAFEVPPEPQSSCPKKKAKLSKTAAQKEVIVIKEKTPERKKRMIDDDAKYTNRMIAAEQKRFVNTINKHVQAMSRWNFVKVEKGSAKVENHTIKISTLKTQVTGTAAALHPSLNPDRDIGGLKNKFDHQRERATPTEANTSAWRGSKWTDESDPGITWFQIPVSKKTLALSGRMVPVSEILAKSVKFPEFTYMGEVMVTQPKTGKEVPDFYKITYEKLSAEQASKRMSGMVKQAKAEAVVRRKDEAAVRRRGRRG
jgi:hypothetical protein